MNIRIAQINPIVGDISGNFELISKTIISSPEHSIVIFPELAITGYPPQVLSPLTFTFGYATSKTVAMLRIAELRIDLFSLPYEPLGLIVKHTL